MPSRSTLLWIVIAAVAVPIGFKRIRMALLSMEVQVEERIVTVLNSLEERNPKQLVNGLTDDYRDEGGGYDRADVRYWANSLVAPGQRYRATLHDPDGLVFLERDEEGVNGPPSVTVQVRCLLERRFKGTEFKPYWDLEFTADMVRESGTWLIRRTRDVNHDERPR